MKILLIRHGKTVGNAQNKYIGITDSPLCEEGIALTKAAGGNEKLKEVYVTPLVRTQQTAVILFPNAKQTVVDDLAEMDFGDFEDRSALDMVEDKDYRTWVEGGCMGVCPNGEGVEGFTRRICAALRSVIQKEHIAGKEKVVLVVHGGVIMAAMSALGTPRKGFYDWYLPNCAAVEAEVCFNPNGTVNLVNYRLTEPA